MAFENQAAKLYERIEVDESGQCFQRRRVYPVLDQDGFIIWFNLFTGGSWFKLLTTLFIIAVMLGFIVEYHNNFSTCAKVFSDLNEQEALKYNLNFSALHIPNATKIIITSGGEKR